MKSKIKIIMGGPDVTDEELEHFRDFDSLLARHRLVPQPTSWWKWALVIVFFLVVITSYILINPINQPSEPENVPVITDTIRTDKELINDSGMYTVKNANVQPAIASKSNQKRSGEKLQSIIYQRPDSLIQATPEILKMDSSDFTESDPLPVKAPPVYVQAVPVDGYEALYAYLSKELVYPEAAVKDSVQGVLIVKFLINKEGRPEKIQTFGSLGVLFEKEAVRLIEHMPLWKPATLNGRPVISKLSIPLTFRLQKK
jgi:TonB family protein